MPARRSLSTGSLVVIPQGRVAGRGGVGMETVAKGIALIEVLESMWTSIGILSGGGEEGWGKGCVEYL